MDESDSPSWKGHSFTLLVFGGIVVLCSIFFVLGMLVGRNQGQRMAEMAAANGVIQTNAPQPLPDSSQPLDFFNQTTQPTPDDTLQPRPEPPTTAEGSVPAAPTPAPEADVSPVIEPVANKFYLQILATRDPKEAERERIKVQSKGFRAVILPPKPSDTEPWHRLQVGPYDTSSEQAMAKQELLSQGYKEVIPK
jgi:cell division protein FtsN